MHATSHTQDRCAQAKKIEILRKIDYMNKEKSEIAEAQMLIRKSASKVFNAFIDPELTKNFWFTKGSDKLEVDKEVEWTWEMYGISSKVVATNIETDKIIEFDWFNEKADPTKVRIEFETYKDENTFVKIEHFGFKQSGKKLLELIKDSTGGFTMVLAGLKSYLEHGINLNLVADKSPDQVQEDCKWKVKK